MENRTPIVPCTEDTETTTPAIGHRPGRRWLLPREKACHVPNDGQRRPRTGARRRGGSSIAALPLFLGLLGATAIGVTPPALAADVSTIAGTGVRGFSGDGGPALAANLSYPTGIAVAPDGTIYFPDTGNYRVRRISTNGIITTVAGNGVNGFITTGDDGDGGPATLATIGVVGSIALSPTGDTLYIADSNNNRVRQVNLNTGIISGFAGTGWTAYGSGGDGGTALNASFQVPVAVAVDGDGNVLIGDESSCIIRRVDIATSIISTIAGDPDDCTPSGDGGDALAARLSMAMRLAVDAADNIYFIEGALPTVRRIDAVTRIITTVAGGGTITPGIGDATTMRIVGPRALVVDATHLYISNLSQVFRVDVSTGILSVFAGTGATGFSGDGGPAQDATFLGIDGLAVRGDEVLISDDGNHRLRAVIPPPPLPDDLTVGLATSQAFLDSLSRVAGSILMINVDGREYLVIPNATSVGLNVTLTGNDQLLVIDLSALESAGGDVTISGNLALQTVDLGALSTVGGSLSITGNPALSTILVSGITSIVGDLTVIGTAATVIDLSSLTTVEGSLTITNNPALTEIDTSLMATVDGSIDFSDNPSLTELDASSLTTVGGSIDLSDNPSLTELDASSLTTVGGSIDLSGDTSVTNVDASSLISVGGSITITDATALTELDASSLTTVGGSIDVSGNTSLTELDASSLTTVGGDLDITGNTSVTTIDASSLTTASGSIEVSGNTAATEIDASSLTTVSGDLVIVDNGSATITVSSGADIEGDLLIDTTGSGTFYLGDTTVSGSISLDTTGYTEVGGTTPGDTLDVSATNLEATMNLQLEAATFETPVGFTINRLDPVALVPESGVDEGGAAATIDPIAAYQFAFDVPTLNRDAELSFEIVIAQLDPASQADLLAALAAGTATIATKGDAVGSVFQSFAICADGQSPTVDGCVRVETLNAQGIPTTGTPAIVRFSNVVGHFSTWAVAVVTRNTQANFTEICSTLGNRWIPNAHLFEFSGAKGEKVTIVLAANPAGTFKVGRAALTLFGIGLLKVDVSALPNTITATLPRTGAYYATVAELLKRTGKFSGDYCVSLKSSQNAWRTFRKR